MSTFVHDASGELDKAQDLESVRAEIEALFAIRDQVGHFTRKQFERYEVLAGREQDLRRAASHAPGPAEPPRH